MTIPIVDIFAGPGGLGEGFYSLLDHTNSRIFKVALSIEKDFHAHQTLTLRSFFRQFDSSRIPEDYYNFIKGEISLNELYDKWPIQAQLAYTEAWNAELGNANYGVSDVEVDRKIRKAISNNKKWVLIGGPPCQAYSVVGRSRRQETVLNEKKDHRVELYKQYLRILAFHNPPVFIMENVKGILSARTAKSSVFDNVLKDLADPVSAYYANNKKNGIRLDCPGYRIYSLVLEDKNNEKGKDPFFHPKDYIIKCEKYGIPQTRHRVILLGVRRDIDIVPDILSPQSEVLLSDVLSGLPKLRSGLSKAKDDNDSWLSAVSKLKDADLMEVPYGVKDEIKKQIDKLSISKYKRGADFIKFAWVSSKYKPDWFVDNKINGVCNHVARSHMESDLHRYFFLSCFARNQKKSPQLQDFPQTLLPNHRNVKNGLQGDKKFTDRFRVQMWNKPAKTITSHISQDGHYYIHPDPGQCRSLTVREAARVQTFPDNYLFCGPRTEQYKQVGNAVPPLLAYQIAETVKNVFDLVEENGESRIEMRKEKIIAI